MLFYFALCLQRASEDFALKHGSVFHILGVVIPIDILIFQRGGSTTNQIFIVFLSIETVDLPMKGGDFPLCKIDPEDVILVRNGQRPRRLSLFWATHWSYG